MMNNIFLFRKSMWSFALTIMMASTISHATIMYIDPSSSVIHVNGYGDLSISGSFDATPNPQNFGEPTTSNPLEFSNFNVQISPGIPTANVSFKDLLLVGQFNNYFYSPVTHEIDVRDANDPCDEEVWRSCRGGYFSGTYDGERLTISGYFSPGTYVSEPFGYSYSMELSATVSPVPIPAAFWMMCSALAGLATIVRRRIE